jgi:hypothetical protein
LCVNCNVALGAAKESTHRLTSLLRYLNENT